MLLTGAGDIYSESVNNKNKVYLLKKLVKWSFLLVKETKILNMHLVCLAKVQMVNGLDKILL